MASFGVVRNIPAEFRSVDLKNFFSDFVENEKFKCFHFKHRPEALKPKDKEKTLEKPTKTGTCCDVFQTIDEASLSDFIEKYNNANWVNGKGDYLKARCIIHKIKTSGSIPGDPTSIGHVDSADRYFTRAEQKYNKRHAISETFAESDLLMLSELRPPVAVMPRGNVGTTTKEFMKLIRECKLPPSIIKKLDLKFPLTGSTRRYGNVHMEYTDTYEEAVKGQNTYTANGDLIDKKLPANAEVTNDAERNSAAEEAAASSLGEMSDADDDDDTCEEWERHEALHNDITSHERTKERLFEEEIELKWEKGGSGLVFYTDAQYWREQEGDFDEQTTDDWDVDMSEYYGERGDLDARQYLQMRKEKRRGKAVYDGSLAEELKLRKRKNNTRSRSESPPAVSKKRGDFEKHTKGVGRKLMERDGWKEGEPLGPQERPGAITDPVELDGRDPKKKGGLGYHGEKLLRSSTSGNTRWRPRVRLTNDLKFMGTRSREPLASQSGLFPEYANNLPNNEFKPRSRISRNRAVPGPDDGVVITTVYDDPLRIDEQDDFLRSRPPTAIKHRPKQKYADKEPENVPTKADVSMPSTSTIPLHLTGMKFVKGGVLKDSTTT